MMKKVSKEVLRNISQLNLSEQVKSNENRIVRAKRRINQGQAKTYQLNNPNPQ